MSKVLYKFRGINEFTFKIFENKEFWFSKIEDLNDPNEGVFSIISDEDKEKFIRKQKQSQLEGFFMSWVIDKDTPFFGLNKKEVKKLFKSIKAKKTFDKKYDFINRFVKEKSGRCYSNPNDFFSSIDRKIKRSGILSLTEDPLNKLMWAHYADSHKGIAIGISEYDNDFYKKVIYNNPSEIPKFDLDMLITELKFYYTHQSNEISFEDESFKNALNTKTCEWEYEKEWRGFQENYGSYPINGIISEVIFGLNCSEENKQRIKNILHEKNINAKLKQICKKENSYEFLVENIE